jgi:hypothetical protein
MEADRSTGAFVALTRYCQTAITITVGGTSTLQVVQPTPPARNTALTQSHILHCHKFCVLFFVTRDKIFGKCSLCSTIMIKNCRIIQTYSTIMMNLQYPRHFYVGII